MSDNGTSQDYEEGVSAEAILVKDLDRFDMIFQAFEYEKCKGLDEEAPYLISVHYSSEKN